MTQENGARQHMIDKHYSELMKELKLLNVKIPEEDNLAVRLLVASNIQCEERTRPTPTQKAAYKGVHFNFDSLLDLSIYMILELKDDWELWKSQTKVYDSIDDSTEEGKKLKEKNRPTIDRICSKVVKHYQRGNIRTKLHIQNLLSESTKPQKLMLISPNGELKLFHFESIKELKDTLKIKGCSDEIVKNIDFDSGKPQPLINGFSMVLQGDKTNIDEIGNGREDEFTKVILKKHTYDIDHEKEIIHITEHQIPYNAQKILIKLKESTQQE